MTIVTGFFRDSGRIPISTGGLTFQLDAPISDLTSIYTTQPRDFEIVNGELPVVSGSNPAVRGVELPETQSKNTTYKITLYKTTQSTSSFFLDGTFYDGPTHTFTDGLTYTGSTHSDIAKRVDVVPRSQKEEIKTFHAVMPNIATVRYSDLYPTQISTDKLPTTSAQVAEILATTPQYKNALSARPFARGTFNPQVFYSQGDLVELNGSTFLYISEIATSGNYPPDPAIAKVNTYWMLNAERGSTGTGTAGNNTAYDPAVWAGKSDAPSRNAIRDMVETLANRLNLNDLAPKSNPLFLNPRSDTNPPNGDRSKAIATTQWIGSEFVSQLTQNSPRFYAYKTSTQPLISGDNTLVFNQKSVDTHDSFNVVTATYTVPPDGGGDYDFFANVYFERTSGVSMEALLDILVDATRYRVAWKTGYPGTSLMLPGYLPITLTPGQTVALRVGSSGNVSNVYFAPLIYTWFSGKRIGL